MTDIKVSQRAREAAAQTAEECGKPSVAKHIRAGATDQNWRVQAFARFEQAIRADERERAAKVVDRLESPDGIFMAVRKNWSRRIAAAIRAQRDEP